jgi:hypothetical protein
VFKIDLSAGQSIFVDVDAEVNDEGDPISGLDAFLRIFDNEGIELESSEYQSSYNDYTTDIYKDPYYYFTAYETGSYYIGVSGDSNQSYDANTAGSGTASSTGAYRLQLLSDTSTGSTLRFNNVVTAVDEGGGICRSTSRSVRRPATRSPLR